MHKLVAISGTPGTGKSTWAKILQKKLGWYRLDLHPYYKELAITYNRKKQCYDLDLKKVNSLVRKERKKHEIIVVDSHIAHLLNKIDLCIVLTCSNMKTLEKRLKARNYSKAKVKENLEAEAFQICLVDSHERGLKVLTFDSSKKITQKEFVNKITKNMNP